MSPVTDAYARSQQAGIEHLLSIAREQAPQADTAPLYRCTDQFARLMAEVTAARCLAREDRPSVAARISRFVSAVPRPLRRQNAEAPGRRNGRGRIPITQ